MAPIANEPVLLRNDKDGIATLTLNRGDKFNALSLELINSVQKELNAISRDIAVRVVVIAAAGKAFCAGHDLVEMRADPGLEAMKELFQKCSRMMVTLTKIPQPVIARIHGTATAAGCQLVAQCDLAVAVEDASFATSGINVGLFCSTPMVAVTRNLPRKQAMEMLMTGEFIDAETARQYGLVNRVVPVQKLDEAIFELVDAVSEESVRILVNRIKKNYGTIDILHNNVGASLALGDAVAVDLTEEAFDRSFAVNLKSHWMACKHVIPIMRQQGGGSIVNISSTAAFDGVEGRSAYSSSKAALVSITKVMAKELAKLNIRVNAVAPGLTNTDMMVNNTQDKIISQTLERLSLKRIGQTEEISNVALFLASEMSSYITGQTISVDGGM